MILTLLGTVYFMGIGKRKTSSGVGWLLNKYSASMGFSQISALRIIPGKRWGTTVAQWLRGTRVEMVLDLGLNMGW